MMHTFIKIHKTISATQKNTQNTLKNQKFVSKNIFFHFFNNFQSKNHKISYFWIKI